MNYASILEQTFGPPSGGTPVPPAAAALVPPSLAALWAAHGFAGYRNGFYWTTDPEAFAALLPQWPRVGNGQVIGRDAFANLYILRDAEVLQLNPHRDDLDSVAPKLDLFFAACLAESSFREGYMWEELFDDAVAAHGPLAVDECFAFFPALALGGEVELSALRKARIYEQLSVLAALHAS